MPASDPVYVWRAPLDIPRSLLGALWPTLDPNERAQASAFRSQRLRHRFVASRGIRRLLLGWWIGRPAHELRFHEGPHGKPRLAPPGSARPQFSVAHSGDLAVFALTDPARPVGVDVEAVRPQPADPAVERTLLHPLERHELAGLPPSRRTEAFFKIWTRKEAYLKATGTGLAVPPASVAVPAVGSRRWTARAWRPAPGFVGAVVSDGSGWTVVPLDVSGAGRLLRELAGLAARFDEAAMARSGVGTTR